MGTKLICAFKGTAVELRASSETKLWGKVVFIIAFSRPINEIIQWKMPFGSWNLDW